MDDALDGQLREQYRNELCRKALGSRIAEQASDATNASFLQTVFSIRSNFFLWLCVGGTRRSYWATQIALFVLLPALAAVGARRIGRAATPPVSREAFESADPCALSTAEECLETTSVGRCFRVAGAGGATTCAVRTCVRYDEGRRSSSRRCAEQGKRAETHETYAAYEASVQRNAMLVASVVAILLTSGLSSAGFGLWAWTARARVLKTSALAADVGASVVNATLDASRGRE